VGNWAATETSSSLLEKDDPLDSNQQMPSKFADQELVEAWNLLKPRFKPSLAAKLLGFSKSELTAIAERLYWERQASRGHPRPPQMTQTEAAAKNAAEKKARWYEWRRLQDEEHLSGNQAAWAVGCSPSWCSRMWRLVSRYGDDAFLDHRLKHTKGLIIADRARNTPIAPN
jgi:hypothetical protein